MKIKLYLFLSILLFVKLTSCNSLTDKPSIAAVDSSKLKKQDFKLFWEDFKKSVYTKNGQEFKKLALDSIFINNNRIEIDSFIKVMYNSPFVSDALYKLQNNDGIDIAFDDRDEHNRPVIKKLIADEKLSSYRVVFYVQNPSKAEYILIQTFFIYTINGFKFFSCKTMPTN